MKSSGGRGRWSFNFLGKRSSKPESASKFYCDNFNDVIDSHSFEGITNSQTLKNETRIGKEKLPFVDILDEAHVPTSVSYNCELNDSDELMTFCCGLRKMSSKSTSYDGDPNRACLSKKCRKYTEKCVNISTSLQNIGECNHEVHVTMRGRFGDNDVEVALVPCKKHSFYPQISYNDDDIDGIEDNGDESANDLMKEPQLQEQQHNTNHNVMLSVHQRKKLFEKSVEVIDTTPMRPKPMDSNFPRKHLAGHNFRNSFTTEDADLFMKSSKPNIKRKLSKESSNAPKPNNSSSNLLEEQCLNSFLHSNSHSMRDLLNTGSVEESSMSSSLPQKPSITATSTVMSQRRPRIPPKSDKLLSMVQNQKLIAMSKECRSDRNNPKDGMLDQSRIDQSSKSHNSSLSDSLSSFDSDSIEDSDVDDSTCFNNEVSQGESIGVGLNFQSKSRKVANELLESEKVYVKKLYLIDQIFHMEIIKRNRLDRFIPDEIIPQIFLNIKCIYQFHNNYLLPELTSCINKWDKGPKVGVVMKKAAPFFKLYTDFVTNFSNATGLINAWISKSEKFALILEELQKHPECGNLTLQHHLLEPIQRVPRYQLLLAEYLKVLPEDSSDKEFVEVALKLVSEAAQHTNDEMKKMEKFKKMLDTCAILVYRKDENLISINRELVKEGKMKKISAREGSLLDRYLFLFNDILLVCITDLPRKIGFGQQYGVKSKLDICGMKVYEGNNEDHPNSFVIMSKQKSIEFTASSSDEKNEWLADIWSVIKQFVEKERTKDKEFLKKTYLPQEQLGKRAPTWVKDQDTSMCMICNVTFTTFKRRHHCRACGKVVCNECSARKLRMDYDMERLNRVCDICYGILELSSLPSTTKIIKRHKGPSVLGMKATSEDTVLCSYLNSSTDYKTWLKRWCVLHSNCALYIFKAKKDNAAMDSLPLPGYQVEECKSEESSKLHIFKVFHEKLPRVYFFSTDDKTLLARWLESLKLAIVAELPSSPQVSATSLSMPTLFQANEIELIDEIKEETE